MNASNVTLSLLVGVLFAAGTYLLMQRTLLRVILGFVLLGHGANLVLLLSGGPAGPSPDAATHTAATAADPLPQAMALTAVVITFAVTALLLALVHRNVLLNGHDEVQDDLADRLAGRPPGDDAEGGPA
jgi:multicomponent Na+:H+ antiporter subunit C